MSVKMEHVSIYLYIYLKSNNLLGLVSTSVDSNMRIWDLENGQLVRSIVAAPAEAWKAKFSPDGEYVAAGSYNGDIHLYSIETGEKVKSLSTKNKFLMTIAYVCVFG